MPAAYVDTDYLRFCSTVAGRRHVVDRGGEPAVDVAQLRGRGRTCLVVSGVVVTPEERAALAEAIPGTELTLCRLRASAETLADRILRRGRIEGADSDGAVTDLTLDGLREYGEQAGRFAALLDSRAFADFTVDTDDVPVPDVARQVLAGADGWPG